MKTSLISIVLGLFFISMNSVIGKEIKVEFYAGANHHLFFSAPTFQFDKNRIDTYGPTFKLVPSWGWEIGSGIEIGGYRKLSCKLILELSKYQIIYKTDSASAIYNKKYFLDPLISSERRIYLVCFPILFSYAPGSVSLDLGIRPSIYFFGEAADYTVTGNSYKWEFNGYGFLFDTKLEARINFPIGHYLKVSFGYDHKVNDVFGLSFFKLGVIYSIKIIK